MNPFNPIHHSFGPHATVKVCMQAKFLMCVPWKWKNGKSIQRLKDVISNKFEIQNVSLFATGRESLLAVLKACNLQTGEEVIIQGYTCSVVPSAIHAAKGVPVYADIDKNTLNMTTESVEALINSRTKAVICQHTFGIPAPVKDLRSICNEHGILLIEDCAHIMPDENGPEEIGKYGDYVFFSFGRDKAISGVSGGAAASRNPEGSVKLESEENQANQLSSYTIFRLLFYPCIYVIAKQFYGLGIGKALLVLFRKVGALMPYVSKDEKQGHMSPMINKLPNACSALALKQIKQLQKINNHRRKLTEYYLNESKELNLDYPQNITNNMPLQKFPIFIDDADLIRQQLKSKNVYLDDGWTGSAVCPRSSNLSAANYEKNSCTVAEQCAINILSLPTHPTMKIKQAKRLMRLLSSR
ncbi:aminotransferase class I/II-fold pyridoxal phosphate-dependent enzyme [Candidatus Peregrinibacteria bacterium]|jgi:perosamine synthetase|nr:aminotransferase class I/II-fold pyridoxal phosphate-dependent enzyme [Candidatus Peregrinibacteria bacterium]MBT3599055.1 aminotransferase class I/II-fold pyridoxal phosphate-dependent enzyme [Candidatus Peregrinibacteria bacterium]MBT4367196.1 aminotransferase class I/II-fold pyridoxal phosphate-dependent enzyme [Candidatus Peregrinibacteria bacterium]MBT4585265.1 aminotransferase class I/II-fold pyridoxal phosphate-dependent enzyme [Candidatus Peregrinibacteria bacterium]MBT6730639.1 amin